MNIESRAWRVKSEGTSVALTRKSSAETLMVPTSVVPSAHYLARINERQFDRIMSDLFNGAG